MPLREPMSCMLQVRDGDNPGYRPRPQAQIDPLFAAAEHGG
ncbi:hypothetical protein [Inquilinus sp. Marseille-Q2685]|nr:hypothetical protein [Inquilinus sp. Marseille-Q2685]